MASSRRKSDWDRSLYIVGERLHLPLYKLLDEMPLPEFIGWIHHFGGDDGQKEKDPVQILSAFGLPPPGLK